MPNQIVQINKPSPNGPYVETLIDEVVVSGGAVDAGKVVVTNSLGKIDSSIIFGGTGTVTSVDIAAPAEFTVSGSPITVSGTITIGKAVESPNYIWAGPATGNTAAQPTFRAMVPQDIVLGVNPQTGNSYLVSASDNGKLITFNNVSPVAVTLPDASTMPVGFNFAVSNLGTGMVTLTPTTSTIDSISSLSLYTSAGIEIYSDNTNYETIRGLGSGTVTSVAIAAPTEFIVSNSPIVGAGTITISKATESPNYFWAGPASGNIAAQPTFRAMVPQDSVRGVNPQTGTTYIVVSTDNGKLVTLNNTNPVAVTLPNAATMPIGFNLAISNLGAGTATITPTTSTIDGVSSIALITGQGIEIYSDNTNYETVRGSGSSIVLQTNSVNNSSQSTLNLENGNQITVTNTSGGIVTIAATGTIWNFTSPPSSLIGVNGDFWFNTSTGELFGPKAGGVWPSTGYALPSYVANATYVYAGPISGAAVEPAFRALVATDIPALPYLSSSTVLPSNTNAVAREWLNSYNSATGAFGQTQPAASDLSNGTTGSGSVVLATGPTFSGTVVIPTPFTLGAISVTTTGTQLNYLNAATGTTGTTSTNIVFSTSPSLTTPNIGAATATSIAGITSSITPNIAGGGSVGTTALPFGSFYVGTAATNNQQITSAATTAARVFTLPDANSNPIQPLGSATASEWVQYIDSAGTQHLSQPQYSDIQMGSGFLLGRDDAGTGAVEEISVGSGLTMSGNVLAYSGTASAGVGVSFYYYDPVLIPVGANNAYEVDEIVTAPSSQAEQTDSIAVTAATSPVPWEFYVTASALGRTILDGGVWEANWWAGVNSVAGGRVSSLQVNVFDMFPSAGTGAFTGAGATRTFTVTGDTPFVAGDANASKLLSGWVYVPSRGVYNITAFTSSSVVTVATPGTFTNASGLTFYVARFLFGIPSSTITAISPAYALTQASSAQQQFTLVGGTSDYLAMMGFGISNNTTTVTYVHSGTIRPSNVQSPLATLHNQLAGLQGGTSGEYYHITSQQNTVVGDIGLASGTTGTNTTNIVFSGGSPTFTGTPVLGSPTATTPATGDNSTNVATTAFVNTIMSTVTVNVAGNTNVTLTAAQAAAFNVVLTGALTGNIQVINSSTQGDQWFVENSTTGAHTVTWIATSGTGVVIPQGYVSAVLFDGTNSVFGAPPVLPLTGSLGATMASSISGLTGPITPNAAGGTTLGTAALPFSSVYVGGAATNNQQITTGVLTGARVFTMPNANSNPVQPLGSATAGEFVQYIDSSGVQHLATPGSGITLETNGTPNASQTVLNLINGTNVTITDGGSGNITIAAGSGMVWPSGGAGVPYYSGSSSWGTSLTLSGTGTVLALTNGPTFVTPTLGVATASSIIGLTAASTPNVAGGTTIGSAALPFGSYYVGTVITNNVQIVTAGTITAPRVFTLPDANSNPVQPLVSGTASKWVSYIDSTGTQNLTQPSFSDISGTATASQLPYFGAAADGIVAASGGGTVNFLRADGNWANPTAGAMIWPSGGAGIPYYSGSNSWGTSFTTTGTGLVVALQTSPSFVTPSLGSATATSITGLTAATTPNVAGGTSIGSTALPFGSVYIGNAATNNFQITGTATAARVVTLPDANTNTVVPLGSATAGQFVQYIDNSGVQHLAADFTVTLQTNTVNNASQSTLNLVNGTNVTITNTSGGNVSISATSGGAPTRQTTVFTTVATLAPNATENTYTWAIGKAFTIYAITVSAASRVRLYSNQAALTADASRSVYVPPPPGTAHGVIMDMVLNTTTGLGPWTMSPAAVGGDTGHGATPTTAIYYSVQNLSASSAQISVTLSYDIEES